MASLSLNFLTKFSFSLGVARREQRREEEARKLEEKAQKPKKAVVRRTEWEVEFVKVS